MLTDSYKNIFSYRVYANHEVYLQALLNQIVLVDA